MTNKRWAPRRIHVFSGVRKAYATTRAVRGVGTCYLVYTQSIIRHNQQQHAAIYEYTTYLLALRVLLFDDELTIAMSGTLRN